MFPPRVRMILPVDASSNIAAGTVMGWSGQKFIKAVANRTDSFSGNGSSTEFTLTYEDVVFGSVTVSVGGTQKQEGTDYTVNYKKGKITFASAPSNGASISVSYSYFAADPSAVLLEDVTASQSPATALLQVFGVIDSTVVGNIPQDVKMRLLRNGIFVASVKEII